jgi:hypothetical protein
MPYSLLHFYPCLSCKQSRQTTVFVLEITRIIIMIKFSFSVLTPVGFLYSAFKYNDIVHNYTPKIWGKYLQTYSFKSVVSIISSILVLFYIAVVRHV